MREPKMTQVSGYQWQFRLQTNNTKNLKAFFFFFQYKTLRVNRYHPFGKDEKNYYLYIYYGG